MRTRFGDAQHADYGDAILALSYSGESDELLSLLPAIKRFSVKIISITGAPKSSLARYSDVVLNVKVPKEACPFNLAPTSSTTATLVMGDALAMAVLQARGFKQKDYARYHPAGAIGRAMFSRVRDASKAALARLVELCRQEGIVVIDCQLPSRHLESLGARSIPRAQFQALLREHVRPSEQLQLLPP